MDIKLKYLWQDVDRHGNVRVYIAMPHRPKVRLRTSPGSAEFFAEYKAAIEGVDQKPAHDRGSFGWACKQYFASKKFSKLDPLTQKWQRNELENICEKHGGNPIAMMRPQDVRALRDEKPTAGGSNMRLKALRSLFKWGVEVIHLPRNPAKEVDMVQTHSDGYHTWTEDEIEQFEAKHLVGTKARLAMALMLYTTGRREDATRFGPQHVRDNRIVYTQAKNENRNPITLSIPIHPNLQAIIDATPSGHLTFLVTQLGKPFTPAGFGNWFRDQCVAAGVPGRAHGLRKATATRLAELGCTPHELMALLGHRTLKEVMVYTRAAEQKRLADAAMGKLTANKNTPTQKPSGRKNPKTA